MHIYFVVSHADFQVYIDISNFHYHGNINPELELLGISIDGTPKV